MPIFVLKFKRKVFEKVDFLKFKFKKKIKILKYVGLGRK